MNRNKILDFLILICAYVFCACFPFSLFIELDWLIYVCRIILFIGFIIFFYLYLRKNKDLELKKESINLKKIVIFIPLVLACVSNYFVVLFKGASVEYSMNYRILFEILITILVVFIEEMIFRKVFISNFDNASKFKKILLSAVIFGALHITTFLSTFDPFDLIQIIYTFGLGIILGFIYVECESVIPCIGFHFLFNLCNQILFEGLFAIKNYTLYIIVNVIIGVICGLYLLIYFLRNKEKFLIKNSDQTH